MCSLYWVADMNQSPCGLVRNKTQTIRWTANSYVWYSDSSRISWQIIFALTLQNFSFSTWRFFLGRIQSELERLHFQEPGHRFHWIDFLREINSVVELILGGGRGDWDKSEYTLFLSGNLWVPVPYWRARQVDETSIPALKIIFYGTWPTRFPT